MNKNDLDFKKFQEIDRIYQSVRSLLPEDEFPHVVIGGGAIRDLFFDLEIQDIDVYLIPEDMSNPFPDLREALEVLKSRYRVDNALSERKLNKLEKGESDRFGDRYVDAPDRYVLKLMDAYSPKDECSHPIQFLYSNKAETPQELIELFDLDICQFGYDGKEWYVGSEVSIDEVKEALLEGGPVTLLRPSSTYARLKKFHDRFGCSVKKAALDLREYIREETLESTDNRPEFFGESEQDQWVYHKSRFNILEENIDEIHLEDDAPEEDESSESSTFDGDIFY